VELRACWRLAAKDFGAFCIIAKVGPVAYQLQLPPTSKLPPIFQISQLKKHVGTTPVHGYLPEINEKGLSSAATVPVLGRKLGEKGNRTVVYVLVQWSNAEKETP